jgi:leucyl aminopeptidase
VLEDVKSAISNKLVTGASGSMNTFSSKMYEKNYFLVGLGQKNKLTIQTYEKNLNGALKKINGYNINNISLDLNNIDIKDYDHIKAGIIEIEKTQYSYKQKKSSTLKECLLNVSSKISNKQLVTTIDVSVAIANGLNKARILGDTPPNICNPTFLAKEAKKLEKLNRHLKVEILDEKQMRTLKMGSLLSVSQGSTQPAKLVIIKYMPIKNKQPIVLVGKGITFDTGGISLKPSPNMDEMKYDMSGAGSVIGTMQACAEMKK